MGCLTFDYDPFLFSYWTWILIFQSIYVAKTKCWPLWLSSVIKLTKKYLIRNLFQPLLAAKAKFKFHAWIKLNLWIWFSYYKLFTGSFIYYPDRDTPTSIHEYLIDFSCNEAIMVEGANVQTEIFNIHRMFLDPNAPSIVYYLQRGCWRYVAIYITTVDPWFSDHRFSEYLWFSDIFGDDQYLI